MRNHVPRLITTIAIALVPAISAAQDPGPLPSLRVQRIQKDVPVLAPSQVETPPAADAEQCDRLVFAPEARPTSDLTELAIVAACLDDLSDGLRRAGDATASAAVNRDVIQMRINYKRLKKWIPDRLPPPTGGRLPATPKEWTNAVKAERIAARQLQLALRKHDLFATFAAVLVTGASLTDASQPEKEAGTTTAAAESEEKVQEGSTDAQALGTIIWQSRHFGDESIRTVDWSVGGRIGIQPVLNLVTATPPEDAPEGAPPVAGAVHQNAFTWTFGVQMHKPRGPVHSWPFPSTMVPRKPRGSGRPA